MKPCLISLCLLLHVTLFSQVKLKNKYSQLKIQNLTGKQTVKCEIRKICNDGREIFLGTNNTETFKIESDCNQGDVYVFKPVSRNYSKIKKNCAILEQLIRIPLKKEVASLSGSSFLANFSGLPNEYYATSAFSTWELMSLSDSLPKDSLRSQIYVALARYKKNENVYAFSIEDIKSIQRANRLEPTGIIDDRFFTTITPDSLEHRVWNVDFTNQLLMDFDKNLRPTRQNHFVGAYYYYQEGKDLKQSLEWINASLRENNSPKRYNELFLKAKVTNDLGDKANAIVIANESYNLAKRDEKIDPFILMSIEKFINSLK